MLECGDDLDTLVDSIDGITEFIVVLFEELFLCSASVVLSLELVLISFD